MTKAKHDIAFPPGHDLARDGLPPGMGLEQLMLPPEEWNKRQRNINIATGIVAMGDKGRAEVLGNDPDAVADLAECLDVEIAYMI